MPVTDTWMLFSPITQYYSDPYISKITPRSPSKSDAKKDT